jgi:hypothetical protein
MVIPGTDAMDVAATMAMNAGSVSRALARAPARVRGEKAFSRSRLAFGKRRADIEADPPKMVRWRCPVPIPLLSRVELYRRTASPALGQEGSSLTQRDSAGDRLVEWAELTCRTT